MHIPELVGIYSRTLRSLGIGAVTLGLSGCDFLGLVAKEMVVAATSHRGWDTFTFKGQLPAEFGIDVIAFYGANEPGKSSCQTFSIEPGKTITRWYAKQYTTEIQAQPQDFSFEIPLSYYRGLCGMSLGRVKLKINARYGPLDWQTDHGRGGFYLTRNSSDNTAKFDEHNTFKRTGVCSWSFQQSKAHSRFGQLEKNLDCYASLVDISHEDLTNKTVNLKIELNPEEKPSMKNRWITTDTGWKPCQETEKSNRCQTPPIFKTFKMNGQTCTVYPSCTE